MLEAELEGRLRHRRRPAATCRLARIDAVEPRRLANDGRKRPARPATRGASPERSARPDRLPTLNDGQTSRLRVHQVLATLGYGDAIGHEVLGIQRVLRGRRLRVGDLRRRRRTRGSRT